MFCAAGDTTLVLTRHVRERGDLTLEGAIWELSGRQAGLFGFKDRGKIAVGTHADLTVFNLDELEWLPDVRVEDLPGGGARLLRPPGGYRYTIVGGVVTQDHGKATGNFPGSFLSAG